MQEQRTLEFIDLIALLRTAKAKVQQSLELLEDLFKYEAGFVAKGHSVEVDLSDVDEAADLLGVALEDIEHALEEPTSEEERHDS